MLKNIPPELSPELLWAIASMGHGDDLVIGDCNFPAAALSKRVISAYGCRATDILDAVLRFFPLDSFVDAPVTLMEVVPGTLSGEPPVWKEFNGIIQKYESGKKIEKVDRPTFYERTRRAFAAVATTENALYACIIIKKGVVV